MGDASHTKGTAMSDFSSRIPTDFSSQIFSFRTAYLRAVALASMNLEFREALISEKGQVPRNALPILKKYCGYTGTWKLFVAIYEDPDHGPRLDPVIGNTVSRPYLAESITVYIPDRPRELGVDAQMKSLAVLYQDINKWLLESEYADPSPTAVPASPPNPVMDPDQVEAASARAASRYDLGDAVIQFTSFVAALFNAVALGWTNEKFMQLLTRPMEAQAGHTIALLKHWLGYSYPWDLDLKVQIDPKASFKDDRWQIKQPMLSLNLPWMTGALTGKHEIEANRQNPGVAMMGLALYNTDGAGYPFTCG